MLLASEPPALRRARSGVLGWALCAALGCAATTDPVAIVAALGDSTLAAPAGPPPARAERLDLEQALALARAWHPAAHVASARVAAARGEWDQAGRWRNPEIELLTEEGEHNRAAGFGNDARLRATLSWEARVYTGTGARAEAARQDLVAREVEAERDARLVEAGVRLAFVQVLAADRGEALARASFTMAGEALAGVQRRRDAGEGTETEYLRAKIEFDLSEDAVSVATESAAHARRGLAASVGLPGLAIGEVVGELRARWPVLDGATVAARARAWSPGLRVAAARVAASRANVVAADRAGWPDPTLQVGVATAREAGDREWHLEWGLRLPIPVFDANRGAVAAAQANVLQAVAEERQAANGLETAVRDAAAAYTLGREQVLRYQEHILPHAEDNLRIVRSGFPEQFTQLELLDAQRTLATARNELVARLRALAEAAVAIEQLTGAPLDALASEEQR